jgi:TatD DNase family protein
MPPLADSHVHLDDLRFDADRGAVIERAQAAGITIQIVPGVDVASWKRIRELCVSGSGLFPAYGLHPMFMHRHRDEDLTALSHWLKNERPVAVGEIGLDFHGEETDRERQQDYFRKQLDLAKDADLPVILHARAAMDDVTSTLRHVGGLRGVVHSFSGSEQQAEQLWKIGFHLGIGGPVTYERAQRLRRIVSNMPIEYLLLESDAPDQPGAAHRGERNEPAYVADVLQCVAELRGEDVTAVAATVTRNTQKLFRLG